MNNSLLAQAHKALNGDLGNSYSYIPNEDKHLFFDTMLKHYICLEMESSSYIERKYISTTKQFNNYKGDNMNVRDAVIEFKGDINNANRCSRKAIFIFESTANNSTQSKGELVVDDDNYGEDVWREVCTVEQFNTEVDYLASNMGTSTQKDYQTWINSIYPPIPDKKECKSMIDYASPEFWKDALEDCVGAVQYKDGRSTYDHGVFVTASGDFDGYVYCSNGMVGPSMKYYNFIPRPKPSPVFTKEMSDANELPQVGMECLFKHGSQMIKGCVVAVTKRFIVLIDDESMERVRIILESTFKPIDNRTDKEKAIDEILCTMGCKNAGSNSIHYKMAYIIYDAGYIKQLTVEVTPK